MTMNRTTSDILNADTAANTLRHATRLIRRPSTFQACDGAVSTVSVYRWMSFSAAGLRRNVVKQMISFTDPQRQFLIRDAKRLGISIAELVRRKAVALVHEQAMLHGGASQDLAKASADLYYQRLDAMLGAQAKVAVQVSSDGTGGMPDNAPLFRR